MFVCITEMNIIYHMYMYNIVCNLILCFSFVLYLIFVLLLGSTCSRQALQVDFMIAEKVFN